MVNFGICSLIVVFPAPMLIAAVQIIFPDKEWICGSFLASYLSLFSFVNFSFWQLRKEKDMLRGSQGQSFELIRVISDIFIFIRDSFDLIIGHYQGIFGCARQIKLFDSKNCLY